MVKKNILVTGGAGFIGSHLTDRLIEEGHRVVVLDNLSTGRKENLNPKAKFYKCDICSPEISQIFQHEKPEVVYHLAAQIDVRKSVRDPVSDAKINILGSLNVLEYCKRFGIKKIIFSSTGSAIYGDANIVPTPETFPELPLSPYGICKLAIEKYLNYYFQVFSLPYISLRYANVYGPRQNSKGEAGVIAIFCDKILNKQQPIVNGDGKQTRDFVYVDDVVKANILALKSDKIGIFNIGTAEETNINTVFNELQKFIGSEYKEMHGPAVSGEQQRSCLDYLKAEKELGWQPKYSLEKGLSETVEWFKLKNSKII